MDRSLTVAYQRSSLHEEARMEGLFIFRTASAMGIREAKHGF